MAGVDFDRQVFAPPAAPPPRRFPLASLGPGLLILALGSVGLIGYKIYRENLQTAAATATPEVEMLRQQLADMQKRLDQVEKHRRATTPEISVESPAKSAPARRATPSPKVAYRVTSASKLPAIPKSAPAAPQNPPSQGNAVNAEVQNELAANHEAWEATTNRLADVVGVVGTQQGEISETRAAMNQLLAQSRRQAISFELQRGESRMPVGPLALQLKSVDTKTQRYSVCVYVEEKCIELKDRGLNEVVVFVLARGSAPLELVATKIMHGQILGYVEVPLTTQPTPVQNR